MGRPTKLTPITEEIIIECISLGLTYEKSASAARVSRHSVINWKKRGQKAKSGIYFNFFNKLRAAEAAGERINLQKIRKQSYAIDRESVVEGMTGIGAPIRDYTKRVTAALGIAFLSSDKQLEKGKEGIGSTIKLLQKTCENISKELGFNSGQG